MQYNDNAARIKSLETRQGAGAAKPDELKDLQDLKIEQDMLRQDMVDIGIDAGARIVKSESLEESDLVLDRTYLRRYIRDMIVTYINAEDDIEKLTDLLQYVTHKKVKSTSGKRFVVTDEDIVYAITSL